jgi:integrase
MPPNTAPKKAAKPRRKTAKGRPKAPKAPPVPEPEAAAVEATPAAEAAQPEAAPEPERPARQHRPNHVPGYLRQKVKGGAHRAFAILGGRRVSLGRYDTPQSRAKYRRVLAEWLASGRQPKVPSAELTVTELCARYWLHAETYYRDPESGRATGETNWIQVSLRALRSVYGDLLVKDFTPAAMRALREQMVRDGLTRAGVNGRIHRIKRLFKWAASRELLEPSVYGALQLVEPLKSGRCDAPDRDPVTPVPDEDFRKAVEHLPETLAAMMNILLRTGMRCGELCSMRTRDLDLSGPVWLYTPRRHKTAFRGRQRVVCIGPKAKKFLKPFLRADDPDAYLFTPTRKSPNPFPTYRANSLRCALVRACEKAGVPCWSAGQLRHNFATAARKVAGVETTRTALGHADIGMTEIYAERDLDAATKLARRIG